MSRPFTAHRQHGTSLIEVLVAMVVLAIGLLGLVGLQARLQVLQMESYQRAQALMLLHDMATRIESNRNAAATYITAGSLGMGAACPATGRHAQGKGFQRVVHGLAGRRRKRQLCEQRRCHGRRPWAASSHSVGSDRYLVTVAWQGLAPLSAPPVTLTCGAGAYTGGTCTGELCRRVVTTVVRISTL